MADFTTAHFPKRSALVEGLRAYLLIAGMWIRSAMAYRVSFVMLTLLQFVSTGLDFVAIVIMFSHIPRLGGFTLGEVGFIYASSGMAIGLADLITNKIDRLGIRVRDGSLDTLLVRPAPVFIQIAADQFGLHRLGRIMQASVIFGWSITAIDVDWTWTRVAMVPLMLLSGTVIFCAIFVLGGAFQFWASDASEVSSAFTYGGNVLTQYPPTLFAKELVRGATFLVPLAFVNWIPALYILDQPDPLNLPAFADFSSPAVAVVISAVAALAWRGGLRAYRSTGS